MKDLSKTRPYNTIILILGDTLCRDALSSGFVPLRAALHGKPRLYFEWIYWQDKGLKN